MSAAGTAVVVAVTLVVLGATVGGVQYAGGPSLLEMLQAGWGLVEPLLGWLVTLVRAFVDDLQAAS